jgi:hypothetical protein
MWANWIGDGGGGGHGYGTRLTNLTMENYQLSL